jgi:hypothetical protein
MKRIFLGLLPIAFAVGIIDGILPYLHIYILRILSGATAYDLGVYSAYVNIVRIVLNPITLFTVSYFLGKGTEVGLDIKSGIISTFLGCFVGEYVGLLSGTGLMLALLTEFDPLFYLYSTIPSIFTSTLNSVNMFFVSFSGIAIASLRKSKISATSEHSIAGATTS